MSRSALRVDCVIFGGGAAGLFTLARLRAAGVSAIVLESSALGAGQTRCAQGIIHGGTKYALGGILGSDSRAIADMPERWLRMAEGRAAPSLAGARLRARHCWLWRSDGIMGRLGMLGARLALRVRPEEVAAEDRPRVLQSVHGGVLRLAEPVFDPCSVLGTIAAHERGAIWLHRAESLEVRATDPVTSIRVVLSADDAQSPERAVEIESSCVILAAGIGNESLRGRFGRPAGRTQRRPLHQVLLRSRALPHLDGHCIDGDETRVTITSDLDDAGRVVWHLGGRLASTGIHADRTAQLRRAVQEIRAVLPSVPLDGVEGAAYRIDRAEPLEGGRRPEDARLVEEGAILSLWPTKLALAPRAAELAAAAVLARAPRGGASIGRPDPGFVPRAPALAPPPWHDDLEWTPLDSIRPPPGGPG